MDSSYFRWLLGLTLAGALALGGCLRVDVPENINFNGPGSGDRDDDDDDRDGPDQFPSSGEGGWKGMIYDAAGYVMGAEHGVLFYGYDTLAYPGKPVDVAARFQSARDLGGIGEMPLAFYRDDVLVGTAETDADGYARIEWTPPDARDYAFTVRLVDPPEALAKVEPAPLLVSARPRGTEIVVIDLDHTVVASGFDRVLLGGARPMPGASEVVHKIERRYAVVYLTQRPNILTRKSKLWLQAHDFPAAPLMVGRLSDAFDSGKYKTGKLSAMRQAYPNLRIGIGDKLSDAQAYVDNGMTAVLLPNYDPEDAEQMAQVADDIRDLDGRGRLHVVSGWDQVNRVIFGGGSYPPERFARILESQARRRRIEQREEEEEGDDDDDDEDDEDDDDDDEDDDD